MAKTNLLTLMRNNYHVIAREQRDRSNPMTTNTFQEIAALYHSMPERAAQVQGNTDETRSGSLSAMTG